MISSKKMKFAVTTAAATAIVCTGAFAANVTSTTNVNVRSGPGNSYSVLTVMKSGTSTASLGTSGGWTKVSVNGQTGYVYSKYLKTGGSETVSTTASSSSKTVYITASYLNVRSGAGTSNSVIGCLSRGSKASVVGTTNGWYKISYGSGYGYISAKYTSNSAVASGATVTPTANTTTSTQKTVYTVCSLNVRSGGGTSYSVVGVLGSGQSASVVGTSGNWYKIKYGNGYGYISAKYTSSSAPSGGSSTNTTPSTSTGSGSSIVSYAKSFLGCSYVYGAAGPSSFDCSGFTQYVYAHFGKSIPRSSAAQYSGCSKISKSQLQPGDLIFFSSSTAGRVGHVAIYIGDGQMIHAANSRTGVCIGSINSSYYLNHYIGCGRY